MMKKHLLWPLAILVWGVISYLYHPSIETMLSGALLGLALTGLVVWSSTRIPMGKTWILKVFLVAVMAGLMNVTALDVVYSLLAAPEGNRFILPIEMVGSGLILGLIAGLRPLLGSEQKDQQ